MAKLTVLTEGFTGLSFEVNADGRVVEGQALAQSGPNLSCRTLRDASGQRHAVARPDEHRQLAGRHAPSVSLHFTAASTLVGERLRQVPRRLQLSTANTKMEVFVSVAAMLV